MNDLGWIILHRKIWDWGWYRDINTFRLFVHMLLKANWKDEKFMNTTVPRGSFVSSVARLAQETGLTNDEVRTAILHLISTGEITKQSTNKYTVFTVANYVSYQDDPKQEPMQTPSSPQSVPNLFPTIEQRDKRTMKTKKIICSEPEKSAPSPSGISLPLNDKSLYDVPLDKIVIWREAYPAVDIEAELRRMASWLDSNPTRRKTRRGICRFINTWLARTQDRGGNGRREEVMDSGSNAYDTNRRREQVARAIAEAGDGFNQRCDLPFI